MLDDRPTDVLETTPMTAIRLDRAEQLLPELAALADEVRGVRWRLLPEAGPADWRSDAAATYADRLASLRDWFQAGADEIEQAHEGLVARIALMRRAVEAQASAHEREVEAAAWPTT